VNIRLLFFLFLLPIVVYAQSRKPNIGKAPFRKSFEFHTLTHALTDHLDSDSLKVKSIYTWITKNIDYDVYGLTAGGGSYTDPNDILRHRKAVCLGYSILFDSMCAVAGINAECVYGYVYMPWYETGDTLFLDSHAWNVVELNGEWKLIDATWGTGYIKARKQVLRKVLFKLFKIPYATRYRFVHEPNYAYYCTDPEVFVKDHLPSTPAWQLLDCSVPIDSFQRTPQATIDFLAGGLSCEQGNDSIPRIVNAEQQDHVFVAGQQALATNPHNHQDISIGQWERVRFIMALGADTSRSLDERISIYDSAMVMTDSLVKYFKLTSKDALLEGKFFDRRNVRMRNQTQAETKPLIRKHKKAIDNIKRERFLITRQRIKLKRENKRLLLENKRVRKRKMKIKRPTTVNEKQLDMRMALEEQAGYIDDSVSSLKDSMAVTSYYNFCGEVIFYDTVIAQKKRRLRLEYIDMRTVNFYRGMGQTCYDTVVFMPKRQVLLTQKEIDSLNLLLPKPGQWRTDSAARIWKKDATAAKTLLKANMSRYKQMGRLPQGNVDEMAAFAQAQIEIQAINDSLIRHNNERINDLYHYRKSLRKFRWRHYKVRWQLEGELKNEGWRYVLTKNFFKRYYKGVSVMFRHNAAVARKMKSDCRKRKNELNREKRRRAKAEEKRKRKELKMQQQ